MKKMKFGEHTFPKSQSLGSVQLRNELDNVKVVFQEAEYLVHIELL